MLSPSSLAVLLNLTTTTTTTTPQLPSRQCRFHEIAPKLIDINKTVSTAPVLLPDDELINSFRANSIEGIPAQYLGRELGSGFYSITKAEGHNGLIIFSLIRNKTSNRMRFHITLSSAKLSFSAKESFGDSITAVSNSCCYVPSSVTVSGSSMTMEYSQSCQFACRDLAIPVPETGFKNCVVTRKCSADATVSAGVEASMSSSLQQYLSCARNLVCCKLPCVDEMRVKYWCCSSRCQAHYVSECCCIENASLHSSRSVAFEASEQYELGKKACQYIDKTAYLSPAPATVIDHAEAPWTMCPLWTCCCFYEYRGDFTCTCFSKTEEAAEESRVEWNFQKNAADDVFLEFQYRDAEAEAQRIAAKGKGQSAWAQLPGPRQEYLRLRLETTYDNVDQVHESARRFVTQVSVPFGEQYSHLDEAKEEDEVRKLERANKAKAAAAEAEGPAAGGVLGVLYGKK